MSELERLIEKRSQRLEALPFSIALREGSLPVDVGLTWLRTWWALRCALDGALTGAREKCLDPLRSDALAEKLAALDHHGAMAEIPAGAIIDLAEAVALSPDPLAIAAAFDAPALAWWEKAEIGHRGRMIAPTDSPGPEPLRSDAEAAAVAGEILDRVEAVVASLHPPPPVPAGGATVNPAAGTHRITTDPRELVAASSAGRRTWEAFPYYQARYAERGARFTRSDSAWLASLAGHPGIAEDVDWLARVLSARGMPTLLLEVHLEHLYAALAEAVPRREVRYDTLRQRAAALRARRDRTLARDRFDALAASFGRNAPIARVGPIVVGAAVDEAQGVKAAGISVERWLTDPSRFDDDWCGRVRRTLAAARGEVTPAKR